MWLEYLNTSPKLEYYKTVKHESQQECYLKIPIFKYRSALTKLRISAHCLEIERGRYANTNKVQPTARSERLCRYCSEVLQNSVVESESHALNDCPLFIKHRLHFLSNPSIKKFIQDGRSTTVTQIYEKVFSTDFPAVDQNTQNELYFEMSKYCHRIFEHRLTFHDYLDNCNE